MSPAHSDDVTAPPSILGLDHVAFRLADMEGAAKWFERTLGLRDAFPGMWNGVPKMLLSETGTPDLGSGFALFPRDDAGSDSVFSHAAFRVRPEDMDAWRQWLHHQGVDFVEQDHDIAQSIYFEGPDGVRLELTAYQPDSRNKSND